MNTFRAFNPDLIFIGSARMTNIMKTLQTTVFLPKITLGIYKTDLYNTPNSVGSPNENWHFMIEFDNKLDFGITNRYMGTTSEYLEYITNNFNVVTSTRVNSDGIESYKGDLTNVARGSTIGITIQKIIELCSYVSITDLFKSFQTTEVFNKINQSIFY